MGTVKLNCEKPNQEWFTFLKTKLQSSIERGEFEPLCSTVLYKVLCCACVQIRVNGFSNSSIVNLKNIALKYY